MAKKSARMWSRDRSQSLLLRIEESTHLIPLKEKIAQAEFRLRSLKQHLEHTASRMQIHDKQLFEKCVAAQPSRDLARAAMYANECAQVRKMAEVLLFSEFTIEQAMLQLETIEKFGDIVTEMAPVAHVIHMLKGDLSGVVPEVSFETGSTSDMLNALVTESGEASGTFCDFEASGDESKQILNEAVYFADQRMKDRFPNLPSGGQHYLETG